MSGMIECPVCFCSLPASKINNHVEICLNREEKCSTRNEAEVTRSLQSTVNDSNGLSNESKLDDFEGGRSDIGLGLKQNDDRKSDQLVGRVSTQLTNFQSDGEKGKLEDYPSTCAARSIKNVLGKRKWSGLSPPIETKLKLKGPPRDIPITKTILNLPPPLKMRKDNLSKNEKMQDLDTIKNNQVNDSSAINSCTTQSSYNKEKTTRKHNGITNTSIPLAERMRPKDFDTYFGQDEMIGQDSTLRAILNSGKVPSMIFWGPPGCGKVCIVKINLRLETTCITSLGILNTPENPTVCFEIKNVLIFYFILKYQIKIMINGGHLGAKGVMAPIFWKTIVFCSKKMEMCDGILPKQ